MDDFPLALPRNDAAVLKVVADLIERFPDRYPNVRLSEKEFAFQAGQMDIIRRLSEVYNPPSRHA
jgi:hypothetical protein